MVDSNSLGIAVMDNRIWGYERAYLHSHPQIRSLTIENPKDPGKYMPNMTVLVLESTFISTQIDSILIFFPTKLPRVAQAGIYA
jgi:hypothetical protein